MLRDLARSGAARSIGDVDEGLPLRPLRSARVLRERPLRSLRAPARLSPGPGVTGSLDRPGRRGRSPLARSGGKTYRLARITPSTTSATGRCRPGRQPVLPVLSVGRSFPTSTRPGTRAWYKSKSPSGMLHPPVPPVTDREQAGAAKPDWRSSSQRFARSGVPAVLTGTTTPDHAQHQAPRRERELLSDANRTAPSWGIHTRSATTTGTY